MSTVVAKKVVIHYHKDTEEIDRTLTKGQVYATSKGHAVYGGRSQSNGKLLFKDAEKPLQNIYFTREEWETGGNSAESADLTYVKKSTSSTGIIRSKTIAAGLVEGKSRLMDNSKDCFGGQEATYLGFNALYGIKVKYKDGGGTEVYFNGNEFSNRFTIVEVGTPDPAPYVAPSKTKKGKRKK